MNNRIKNAYSHIVLPAHTKQKLYGQIVEEAEKKKNQHLEKHHSVCKVSGIQAVAILAVLFIFILLIYNPVLAKTGLFEDIHNFFHGFLKLNNEIVNYENQDLSDYVSENVFYKSDDHIQFEVLEKISDGVHSYFTVRYTALDDEGKRWLDENDKSIQDVLYAAPLFPDNDLEHYGVNYTSYVEPLDEYDMSHAQYFMLFLATVSADYQSGKVVLEYYMPDGVNTTEFDVSDSLQFKKYKLVGDDNEFFSADYLYVSGLSFVVYGHSKDGVSLEEVSFLVPILNKESVTLYYLEKGEEKYITSGSGNITWGGTNESDFNMYSNLIVASGFMSQEFEVEENIPKVVAFDAESITKIVINDGNGEHAYQTERID